MVRRRYFDGAAALCCGVGVALIAAGYKDIPPQIVILDGLAPFWAILLTLGCLGAGIGSLMRTHNPDRVRQKAWSIRLELTCWPAVAWAAAVFAVGVVVTTGFVNGATTIGWTGFVIFTSTGHWYNTRRALKEGTWLR